MREQWNGSCEGCLNLEGVLRWKEGAADAEFWAQRTAGYRLARQGNVACWGLLSETEIEQMAGEAGDSVNPCTVQGQAPVIEKLHFQSSDFSVTEPLDTTPFPFRD